MKHPMLCYVHSRLYSRIDAKCSTQNHHHSRINAECVAFARSWLTEGRLYTCRNLPHVNCWLETTSLTGRDRGQCICGGCSVHNFHSNQDLRTQADCNQLDSILSPQTKMNQGQDCERNNNLVSMCLRTCTLIHIDYPLRNSYPTYPMYTSRTTCSRITTNTLCIHHRVPFLTIDKVSVFYLWV